MLYFSNRLLAALGAGVVGLGAGILPGVAQEAPIIVADGHLMGQCRQVNREVTVYAKPSVDSGKIAALERGHEVILAEEVALNGWIYIDDPVRGFVQSAFLATCGSFQLPESVAESRQRDFCISEDVDGNVGLPIYSNRSTSSDVLDRVYPKERVTVLGISVFDERTGIQWLQISHPLSGWITNTTSNDSGRNTVVCGDEQ